MDDEAVAELLAGLRKFGAEATGIEVKAARTALPRSCRETLSAFSNTPRGGVLLLGVSEGAGYAVTGVEDARKMQADLASMCSVDIHPPLQPVISIAVIEGQHIVIAEVPELPKQQKPAYVKSLGIARGTYIRIAEADRRLTAEEVQQLVADRGQPLFDRETVPGATWDDLDPRATRDLVDRMKATNARLFAEEPLTTILTMTGAMVRTLDGHAVTLAGLLSLGRYPQQFFPQLNITFVHYPNTSGESTSSGVRFLDNVSINGSIPSMATDALTVIRRNMSRKAMITGAGRRDVWDYPEEALREAIVNALVHRDLSPGSRGMQVQIEMYPDRLEIKNPGGLYGPIDITRLGEEGRSSARNGALMKLLEDVEIPGEERTVCENRGSGIRNMIAALRHAGMGVPDFDDKVTAFKVTLPNHTLLDDATLSWLGTLGRGELRDTQCIGLALMRRGEVLDNGVYRAATGLTDSRAATFELQDLVARELVEQTGTRGGARYTLSPFAASDSEGTRRPRPDRKRQIRDILDLFGELSKTEISEGLRLNPKTVEHWLRQMKADGTVEATVPGRSKNARYRLTVAARQEELFPLKED